MALASACAAATVHELRLGRLPAPLHPDANKTQYTLRYEPDMNDIDGIKFLRPTHNNLMVHLIDHMSQLYKSATLCPISGVNNDADEV
jgi:hypothetical protein